MTDVGSVELRRAGGDVGVNYSGRFDSGQYGAAPALAQHDS